VSSDDLANLPHLVRPGVAALALEVDQLPDVFTSEDMVPSSNPLLEPEHEEEPPQVPEPNVRVGSTRENPPEHPLVLPHVPP